MKDKRIKILKHFKTENLTQESGSEGRSMSNSQKSQWKGWVKTLLPIKKFYLKMGPATFLLFSFFFRHKFDKKTVGF